MGLAGHLFNERAHRGRKLPMQVGDHGAMFRMQSGCQILEERGACMPRLHSRLTGFANHCQATSLLVDPPTAILLTGVLYGAA